MTILVTGANGQLGNELRIIGSLSQDTFVFTDVVSQEGCETVTLDITDLDAVRAAVRKYDVDAIVNCAAFTNVDAAESNAELSERLNASAPANLALVMKETGGLLVHISTDYVFGKEPYNTPCSEDRKGTPTGVYGLTKLHGEQNVMASGCRYMIIRTAWLYSEFGRNFCKTMLNLTSQKPELKVVFDQVGTPTYALDLAEAIVVMLRNPVQGIYNFSNEGVCSWYDFTKMIQEIAVSEETETNSASFGRHALCKVMPCHSSEFPSPVVRPSYSVLDKTRIKETFGLQIPYWTDSLRKCIHRIASGENHAVHSV